MREMMMSCLSMRTCHTIDPAQECVRVTPHCVLWVVAVVLQGSVVSGRLHLRSKLKVHLAELLRWQPRLLLALPPRRHPEASNSLLQPLRLPSPPAPNL